MKLVIFIREGYVQIGGKMMKWKMPITIESEIDYIPKVKPRGTIVQVGRKTVEVI